MPGLNTMTMSALKPPAKALPLLPDWIYLLTPELPSCTKARPEIARVRTALPETTAMANRKLANQKEQADIARTQAEAKQDYLDRLKPDHLPKIDIGGDPDSGSGKRLKNGDTLTTTSKDQTLTRPDGEKLTVRADGSFDVDFKLTGDIKPGDGKIERGANGVSRVHLGGEKDGENILVDDKGIISISNPYTTVAVRGH